MIGLLVFLKQYIVKLLSGPTTLEETIDSELDDEDDDDKDKVLTI